MKNRWYLCTLRLINYFPISCVNANFKLQIDGTSKQITRYFKTIG